MTTRNITSRSKALARQTEDAYSSKTYGSWPAVAKALLQAGYTEAEAEAIMRSKITRRAADVSRYPSGRVPAQAIIDYIKDERNGVTPDYVTTLVISTLGLSTRQAESIVQARDVLHRAWTKATVRHYAQLYEAVGQALKLLGDAMPRA